MSAFSVFGAGFAVYRSYSTSDILCYRVTLEAEVDGSRVLAAEVRALDAFDITGEAVTSISATAENCSQSRARRCRSQSALPRRGTVRRGSEHGSPLARVHQLNRDRPRVTLPADKLPTLVRFRDLIVFQLGAVAAGLRRT